MAQEIKPKRVITYVDEHGNEPYTDWIYGLKDQKSRERIIDRIMRLQNGLYGDCEPVGKGILELRMFFGAGYRIYFGEDDKNLVILLCGGDKKTQKRDIKAAKLYWKDFKNEN